MKILSKSVSLFLLVAIIFSTVPGIIFYAKGEKAKEEKYVLSSDSRLAEALENYEKGQKFLKKGHREFRGRPGLAQKHFEYAEDYFNRAVFSYRELGEKYRIDTGHEIAVCEKLYREAHVMVNKSRRKRKRPGAGY